MLFERSSVSLTRVCVYCPVHFSELLQSNCKKQLLKKCVVQRFNFFRGLVGAFDSACFTNFQIFSVGSRDNYPAASPIYVSVVFSALCLLSGES